MSNIVVMRRFNEVAEALYRLRGELEEEATLYDRPHSGEPRDIRARVCADQSETVFALEGKIENIRAQVMHVLFGAEKIIGGPRGDREFRSAVDEFRREAADLGVGVVSGTE